MSLNRAPVPGGYGRQAGSPSLVRASARAIARPRPPRSRTRDPSRRTSLSKIRVAMYEHSVQNSVTSIFMPRTAGRQGSGRDSYPGPCGTSAERRASPGDGRAVAQGLRATVGDTGIAPVAPEV